MTKKHFIALAEVARRIRIIENPGTANRIITDLADFCAEQNPRFKRQRWLDYVEGKCGPNGGKV